MDRQPPGDHAGRAASASASIVALVTVVVVVGAVILWRFFGDALSSRSEAGAARCVDGEVAVAVVADPSIADQIGATRRAVQPDRGPGRRPVRQGRRQGRRLRCRWSTASPAHGPANSVSAGAVDSRQLGVRGPAGGRRRREDRQRQPLAGHLAGGAGRAPSAEERAGDNRIGRRCPGCRATRLRWTG